MIASFTGKKAACFLFFIMLLISTCVCLPIVSTADENVVYVSYSNGNDGNAGTAESPLKTTTAAINALQAGGTVVITDRYTMDSDISTVAGLPTYAEPAHTGEITFTSVYDGVDYRQKGAVLYFPKKMTYSCSGNVIFQDITFESQAVEVYMVGNFNSIHFAKGFEAKNTSGDAKFLFAIGGYLAPQSADLPADKDSNITIESGAFKRVMGFSWQKGTAIYTFTGTANITVSGGAIDVLYGGSALNHYSGNLRLTVSGGTHGTIYAAGDVTRPLLGTAEIRLLGGSVKNIYINNVIGNAALVLENGKLTGEASVSYKSDELAADAKDSVKKLFYNTENFKETLASSIAGITAKEGYGDLKNIDTASLLESQEITPITPPEKPPVTPPEITEFPTGAGTPASANAAYVSSAKGNDQNAGTKAAPFQTITKAIESLSATGGVVVLTDRYVMGENTEILNEVRTYTEPEHIGKITITGIYDGVNYGAKGAQIYFPEKMTYNLNGDTTFEYLTITSDANDVYFAGQFHKMEFGEGFICKNTLGQAKFAFAIGGYYSPHTWSLPSDLDAHIIIRSGSFKRIMGFAYVKGVATFTFTGTAYITVYDGHIDRIYGGTSLNHYGGSSKIRVEGGSLGDIYAAGDATRRLNGSATIELMDGTIKNLFINNVLGDTDILLDRADLSALQVSYANETIANLAYGSKISLRYNSVFHNAEWVNSLEGLTEIERFGAVYLKQGALGDGKSADTPTGNLDTAIKLLANGGGSVVVIGNYNVKDYTEPEHAEAIRFVGQAENLSGGSLTINGTWSLSGETCFDSITINGSGVFEARHDTLRFGSETIINGQFDIFGGYARRSGTKGASGRIEILGGAFNTVCGLGMGASDTQFNTSYIEIGGGHVKTVIGASSKAGYADSVTVSVSGGTIDEIRITDGESSGVKNAALEISGGEISNVNLNRVTEQATLRLSGGTIRNFKFENTDCTKTLRYNPAKTENALIESLQTQFNEVLPEQTVYVKDGADGNGFTPAHPVGSLKQAFENLSVGGGTIVICGPMAIAETLILPKADAPILLTGVYDGIDYRDTEQARITMGAHILFQSEVSLEALEIESVENSVYLIFNGNKAKIGADMRSFMAPNVSAYTGLVAGSNTGKAIVNTDLTVESGTWNHVYGGNIAGGTYDSSDFNLTINGGEIFGKVIASGRGNQSGNSHLTVNGGTLYSGIFGTAPTPKEESYTGNIDITISGGTIYGKITIATSYASAMLGKYTVTVNGGDFSHLTDIEGDAKYSGRITSTCHIGENADLSSERVDSFTYQNPIRRTADPRIALVNGMYYYVYTSGSTLSVYKAANVSDLAYALPELVWDAREVSEALEGRTGNIWPSEIQYFSADEFGEEHAGWYLFFSTYDPGTTESGKVDGSNRRSYVLKCTSDELQGEWVNPETGEKNIPARFGSDTYDWVNKTDWTAGESTLRYGGKTYALWIGQTGRGTEAFKQTMYLSELKNPWTVTGPILELVNPEYDWERVGYGYSAAEKIWYPAVIEGATPIYGANGELFVLYAASGYWTTEYCVGQMKFLGGDLFDIKNWEKSPQPVFSKNQEVNGVGGLSPVTTPDGKTQYILYHGYLGETTASGRYCFMEPYTVDASGVHFGADGHPSPLDTSFVLALNQTHLLKKISGFDEQDTNFLFTEITTVSGAITPEILDLKVYGGAPYDSSFGDVKFCYSSDDVSFEEGLPQKPGTYTIRASLTGQYAFDGLGGTFSVTITDPAGNVPESSDKTSEQSNKTSGWILPAAISAVCVVGAVIGIFALKKSILKGKK